MSTQPSRILSWRDWFTDLNDGQIMAMKDSGRMSLHGIIPMIRPILRRKRTPKEEAERLVNIAKSRWEFATVRRIGGVSVTRPDLPLCVLYQNVGWGVLSREGGPANDWEMELLRVLADMTVELIEEHQQAGGTVAGILLDAEGYGTDADRRAWRDFALEEAFYSRIAVDYPDVLLGNYGSRETPSAASQPVFYEDMIDAAAGIARLEPGAIGNPWIPMPGFVRRHGNGVVTTGDFSGYLWACSHAGGTVLLWGDNRSRARWGDIDRVLDLHSHQFGRFPWADREGYGSDVAFDGELVDPDPERRWL